MRKNELIALVTELKSALYYANFANSSFEQLVPDAPYPTRESEVNEFIKARTRKLRKEKIADKIEHAIAKLQTELDKC